MITSGLVVDGVGHGLQAHLPYNHQAVAAAVHNHRMSYAEPPAYLKSVVPPPPSSQLQQQQQQQQSSEPPATPEFLRPPLPKPAPVNPLKAPRASAKYAAAAECRPVNLTAVKEPLPPPPPPPSVEHHLRLDDRHHPYSVYGHPRLYVSASPYHPYPMHQPPAPYGVYTSPYAPVIPRDTRHHLMQPPPQERRYPSPPNKNGCGGGVVVGGGVGSRASPSSSPPEPFKVPNGRDNNKPPPQPQQQLQQQQQRILPPPPPPPPTSTFAALAVNSNNNNNNVVVAAAEPSPKKSRRKTPEPQSPPAIAAAKTSNFTKGSLIRLANGNIKKVEDMRTEDFLNSVEHSVLHRIDASTVVRIEPISDQTAAKGNMKITLSLGDQRNHQVNGDNHNKKTSVTAAAACKPQHVEVESGAEHPYFVFGRGWASCSPAKTLAKYGLTCQRLQVGDVCVSLTRRPTAAADSTTTATTPQGGGKRRHHQHQQPPTSVAVHQQQQQQPPHNNHGQQQQQLHQQQHHYHNNNNNINSNNNHHSTGVQKTQMPLHHLQQQQLQPPPANDEKNGRNKRRWSAPDPEPAT